MSAPQRRRTDAPQPPPRLRKADRKRQLLGHAKRLFVTLGYQDTTTETTDIAAGRMAFYLDSEQLLSGVITEGQQAGVFRRSLDPRVGAWELIRTALGYTLTLPLVIPLYEEPDYLPRAIDCLLHCLLKTDV